MFELLFSIPFIILSLIVNCIVAYTKSIILKIRNNNPLPFQRQIMQAILFLGAMIATFLSFKMGLFTVLISDNWIFTGFWIAMLSMVIYELGLKKIFDVVGGNIMKLLSKPPSNNDNTTDNKSTSTDTNNLSDK